MTSDPAELEGCLAFFKLCRGPEIQVSVGQRFQLQQSIADFNCHHSDDAECHRPWTVKPNLGKLLHIVQEFHCVSQRTATCIVTRRIAIRSQTRFLHLVNASSRRGPKFGHIITEITFAMKLRFQDCNPEYVIRILQFRTCNT